MDRPAFDSKDIRLIYTEPNDASLVRDLRQPCVVDTAVTALIRSTQALHVRYFDVSRHCLPGRRVIENPCVICSTCSYATKFESWSPHVVSRIGTHRASCSMSIGHIVVLTSYADMTMTHQSGAAPYYTG